jgi:hypothetical protein
LVRSWETTPGQLGGTHTRWGVIDWAAAGPGRYRQTASRRPFCHVLRRYAARFGATLLATIASVALRILVASRPSAHDIAVYYVSAFRGSK